MKNKFLTILLSFLLVSFTNSHDISLDNISANSIAQLGICFYNNKDISNAIEFLTIAFDQKQFWTGYYLSEIYATDIAIPFVKKDYDLAIKYLLMAAKSNCPKSQFKLAQWLFKGDIAQKDITRGLWWLTESAKLGYNPAKFELAQYYHDQKNYTVAIDYLLDAAKNGDLKSQLQLSQYILTVNLIKKEDKQRIINFLKDIAEKNNIFAQSELGYYCYKLKKLPIAEFWLKQAAKSKLIKPKYILAKIYNYQSKYLKALNYLLDILALTNAGKYINQVEKELKKIKIKNLDLEQNKDFNFAWGLIYIKKQDYKKACFWLEKAANLNSKLAIKELKNLSKHKVAEAQFALGKIYLNKNSSDKALKYFEKSKKNSCAAASFYISKLKLDLA